MTCSKSFATLGFNFFFIPPVHTFTVEDPRNVVALFVFLFSGLLIGRLSALARGRLRQLELERADLAALVRLSQAFLSDTNHESLLGAAGERLRGALNAERVEILLADEKRGLALESSSLHRPIRFDLAELAFRRGRSATIPSDLGGTEIYMPIPVGLQRAGVLVARGMKSSERLAEGYRRALKLLRANRDVKGIYVSTVNSLPVLQAAEQEGRLQNLTIVTTDLFPELVEWVRAGKVAATLYQRPLTQGRLALQALHQYLLDGTCPPPRIAVAPHVVMRSNLNLFLDRLPVDSEN